jgi:hypothetical protein
MTSTRFQGRWFLPPNRQIGPKTEHSAAENLRQKAGLKQAAKANYEILPFNAGANNQ